MLTKEYRDFLKEIPRMVEKLLEEDRALAKDLELLSSGDEAYNLGSTQHLPVPQEMAGVYTLRTR